MKEAVLAAALALAPRLEPIVLPGAFDAPTACRVQVLDAPEGRIRLAFWFTWPDETHPRAWADAPYRLFRRLWFGTTEDMEFVWVEADAATGRALSLAFESPEPGWLLVGHKLERSDAFPVRDGRPVLAVASWNHLFRPADAASTETSALAPLERLTPERAAELRLGRRSPLP